MPVFRLKLTEHFKHLFPLFGKWLPFKTNAVELLFAGCVEFTIPFELPLGNYPPSQLGIHDTVTRFSVVHWPNILNQFCEHGFPFTIIRVPSKPDFVHLPHLVSRQVVPLICYALVINPACQFGICLPIGGNIAMPVQLEEFEQFRKHLAPVARYGHVEIRR